jgi:hypothetical protein
MSVSAPVSPTAYSSSVVTVHVFVGVTVGVFVAVTVGVCVGVVLGV